MALGDGWEQIDRIVRQHAQAQAQVQQGAQTAQQGPPNRTPPTLDMLAVRAREMFLKRMGGLKAEMRVAANDFLQCHVDANKVYLFYCFGGRHGAVMEDIDMFPSDQLITQFRLVLVSE